jgi:hypothetical protein
MVAPIQSGSARRGNKVAVKNAEESIQRGKNTAAQQEKRWPSRKKPAFRKQPIIHGRET